jgi:hypothetical protein
VPPRQAVLGIHPVLWIALLALVLHGRDIGYPFVGDDRWQIEPLPSHITREALTTAWTTDHWGGRRAGLYRPLLHTLWIGEAALGGAHRAPLVRVVNLGLLVGGAWLFLIFLRRVGVAPEAALFAAAVPIVHPASVEVANHGVGQAELLNAILTLACLLFTLRLARDTDGRSGAGWVITLIAALVFLGSLIKETMYLIPLICVALLVAESRSRAWGRPLALAGATGLAVALAISLRLAALHGAFSPSLEHTVLGNLTWPDRVRTALALALRYAKETVVPAMPAVDYSHLTPHFPPPPAWWLGGLALCLGALGAAIALAPRHRRAPVALIWFGAVIAPVLQLVPVGAVFASRFLWPALFPAAWAGAWVIERGARAAPRPVWSLASAWLAVCAVFFTFPHVGEHRSELALWRASAERHPDNPVALQRLAAELLRQASRREDPAPLRGEANLAIRRSLALDSESADAWATLGRLEMDEGHPSAAEEDFVEALRLVPDNAPALFDLGVLKTTRRDWAGARECWERVLEIDPHYPNARAFLDRLPKQ